VSAVVRRAGPALREPALADKLAQGLAVPAADQSVRNTQLS